MRIGRFYFRHDGALDSYCFALLGNGTRMETGRSQVKHCQREHGDTSEGTGQMNASLKSGEP